MSNFFSIGMFNNKNINNMNVYDFAPDLDLSKEVEGSIFGVKGIGGSDGIVYAKVVSCVDVKDYSCDRCIFL